MLFGFKSAYDKKYLTNIYVNEFMLTILYKKENTPWKLKCPSSIVCICMYSMYVPQL